MKKLSVMLLLLAWSLPGWSETIVDTPLGLIGWGLSSEQSVAVSWTVSSGFDQVSIAAPFWAAQRDLSLTGTAYLAASTPNASILSSQFSFPTLAADAALQPAYVALFQNLTLAPGTYYLTVMSTALSTLEGWGRAAPVVADTAPGFTLGQTYLGNPADGPYTGQELSPSGFRDVTDFGGAGLRILDDSTSDPITAAPEPPTYALMLGIALIALALLRWKKASHNET